MDADLYEILQVQPTADPAIVEAAYRRLGKLYHPDINPAADAHRRMSAINRAYAIVGDPARRADYDRSRSASSIAGGDEPPAVKPTFSVARSDSSSSPRAPTRTAPAATARKRSSSRAYIGIAFGAVLLIGGWTWMIGPADRAQERVTATPLAIRVASSSAPTPTPWPTRQPTATPWFSFEETPAAPTRHGGGGIVLRELDVKPGAAGWSFRDSLGWAGDDQTTRLNGPTAPTLGSSNP